MATRSLLNLPNVLIGFLLTASVLAQTQLNLRNQGRNVDFSNASSTRPTKTGVALPSTCGVGELFFRTDRPAGKNLYGCTIPDNWSLLAETITPSGMANYVVPFTNQTSLSITAAMHGFESANLLVTCFDAAHPASVLSPSGVTIDSTTFGVTISFSGSRSGRCVINAPGTAYTTAEGLSQSGPEFSVDPATVPSFLKDQAALTGWTIPPQACAERQHALVGAALLDTVVPGWPADLNVSLTGTMLVSEAEIVTIRLCNVCSGPVNVPARTFGIAILKSF